MTDVLTLADARLALRKAASDTGDDADLLATYVPAVTPIVEDLAGPVTGGSRTRVADGGKTFVLLPSAAASVTSVTESLTTLVANVDYTVNLESGIVTRGSMQQPYIFLPGSQNITVVYVAPSTINANHKLAGRIILRQLWIADQQGNRPAFGAPDTDTVLTPSGFAIPRRAYELLTPTPNVPGFA